MVKTQNGGVYTLYDTGAKEKSNKKPPEKVHRAVMRFQLW